MKAVVAAFNQEKALVGAFSVITNLRTFFEALAAGQWPARQRGRALRVLLQRRPGRGGRPYLGLQLQARVTGHGNRIYCSCAAARRGTSDNSDKCSIGFSCTAPAATKSVSTPRRDRQSHLATGSGNTSIIRRTIYSDLYLEDFNIFVKTVVVFCMHLSCR